MRLLTGKDRIAFEAILQGMAALEAENTSLKSLSANHRSYIDFLREDVSRERQRADNAIDELLAMRGIAPVSVPPEPQDLGGGDLFEEDPGDVARIEKQMMEQGYGSVLLGKETG